LTGWLASVGGTELAFAFAGGMGLVATAWAAARLRGGLRLPRRREPVLAAEEG
jgi:hypothetical protein